MSIKAISWAFDQKLKPGPKLVLLKLADNANDEGYCWPSMKHICAHTGLSRSSVIRHIKALEAAGLLETKRRAKDGVNLPNHYQLPLPNLQGVVSQRHRGVVSPCDQGSVTMTPGGSVTVTPKPSGKATVIEPSERERARKPEWCSDQLWSDMLANRRAVKAPLTATAWSRIEDQIERGVERGHDRADMLAEMIEAGWRGFKLDWYERRVSKGPRQAASSNNAQTAAEWAETNNGDRS